MGRGMAGEDQIPSPLADDLVADGRGDPVGPETADAQIVPVVDEPLHRFFHRHYFVFEGPVLLLKNSRALSASGSMKRGPSP